VVVPVAGGAARDLEGTVDGGVSTLAVSPDGEVVAAITEGGAVHAWSLPSGKRLWDQPKGTASRGQDHPPIAFSPVARWLAVAAGEGGVAILDRTSGRLQSELGGSAARRRPEDIVFVDASTLAAKHTDHVSLWSLRSGLRLQGALVAGLVGMWSEQGALHVVAAPAEKRERSAPSSAACGDLVPVSDEKWSPGANDGWSRPAIERRAACGVARALAMARGRAVLPSAVVDLATAHVTELHDTLFRASARMDVSPSGKVVFAPSITGGVSPQYQEGRWWSVDTGERIVAARVNVPWQERAGAPPRVEGVPQCDFHLGEGKAAGTITSASTAARAHVAPPADAGDPAWMRTTPPQGGATSPDDAYGAVFSGDTISIIELATGKTKSDFTTPARVSAVAFASATRVLVGMDDGSFAIYEAGAPIARGESPGGAIARIVPAPDGSVVATISDDDGVRLWDPRTGTLRATFAEFDDDEFVAYTPEGAYIGTGEVAERVGWVFDEPIEYFRFEQFASSFRDADFVARRLAGRAGKLYAQPGRPPRVANIASVVDGAHASVHVRAAGDEPVDQVRLYVDGRPVASRRVCATNATIDLDVPLLPGNNLVSAVAFDARGYSSNPANVQLESAARSARKPDLWVVSVGVNSYPRLGPELQLHLADDDARGIATLLERSAGDGGLYERVHVTTLTDEQATVGSIRSALGALERMRAEDVAVVFLAGHGVKAASESEMVFLTPEVSPTVRELSAHGLGWSRIGDLLGRAKGRVLLLLDACHSGDVSRAPVVPNNALAQELVREGRAGVIVFAAAKGRQVSFEPNGARGLVLDAEVKPLVLPPDAEPHGFFTGALLGSLRDPATDANGDGDIEVAEMIDEVSRRVSRATGSLQTPWVARRELFGDFRLVRAARPATPARAP
jgi:WD40 repeat protein